MEKEEGEGKMNETLRSFLVSFAAGLGVALVMMGGFWLFFSQLL